MMKILALILASFSIAAAGCAAQQGGGGDALARKKKLAAMRGGPGGGDGSVMCLEGQTARNGQCVSDGGPRK